MKISPEIWGIIGSVVSAVVGWFSKSLWGRHIENASTKNFLQGEIDKLYAKLNELMKEQLSNTEKIIQLSMDLHKTQAELNQYKKDLTNARSTIAKLQARIKELEAH